MLTRSGKKTLILKLNDPHVNEYITTIERHLCNHIEALESEVRQADDMYYEKVEELEESESYVYSLRNKILSLRSLSVVQCFVTLAFVGYMCTC